MTWTRFSARTGDQDFPGRARRDLVCGRCHLGRVGPGRRPAPGRRHRRPGHPAGPRHLVPGHQPARPGGPRDADSPHPAAGLAEIVRLYSIRNWIEQSYKQVKDELGWADFQVRSDLAIRRHQVLVNCAFSFCWDAWFAHPPPPATPPDPGAGGGERGALTPGPSPPPSWPRGSRCNAGGPPGRTRPRPRRCKP